MEAETKNCRHDSVENYLNPLTPYLFHFQKCQLQYYSIIISQPSPTDHLFQPASKMFPTPPPTRSLGSRQREGSSGDGSMGSAGSRISSQDAFRMGGPGLLPSWPVQMGVSEGLSEQFRERLMNLALEYLGKYQLSYHRLMVVRRYSEGLIPSPADNTLYISLYTPSNDNWVKALDDILSAIEPLQFTGRVEMIDHRALGGMKTFPPRYARPTSPRMGANTINHHSLSGLHPNKLESSNASKEGILGRSCC